MAPVVLADIESGRAKLEAHEIRRFAKLHSRQRRTPPRQRLQISGIPTRRPTNTPFLFRLRKTTPMIRFNSYAKVNNTTHAPGLCYGYRAGSDENVSADFIERFA